MDEPKLDLKLVDQIFDEFDNVTNVMIEDWQEGINWGDNDQRITYLKLKNMAKRSSALDKLVPDRICPECNKSESNDSNWRIDKFHSMAICMTCFCSNHFFRGTNSHFIPEKDERNLLESINDIFHSPQVKFLVNGKQFRKVRAILGITKVRMAKALGVTPMTICKMEEGIILSMPRERIILCMKVFKKALAKRLEPLGYKEEFDYKNPEIEEIK